MIGYPALLLLTAGLAFASPPATAATCDGVEFPDQVSLDGADLVLNGLGLRKATIFHVKVYVAGLYLPQKAGDPGQILGAGQSWRLGLHFVHDVDASDMEQALREGFENSGADVAPLQARIDALVGMLVDFEAGQALWFSNSPAKGVAVEVDGAAEGVVDGQDFASALLAIWIGSEPPNEDLKAGLLGGACE